MAHDEIYKRFTEAVGPKVTADVEEWFPNGKNSIRFRLYGSDSVFTVSEESPGMWQIESLDSYIAKMKGGHMMNVGLHDSSDKDTE